MSSAERANRALRRSVASPCPTDHEVGTDGRHALVELLLGAGVGLELGHATRDELGLGGGQGVELGTSACVGGLETVASRGDAGRAGFGVLGRGCGDELCAT